MKFISYKTIAVLSILVGVSLIAFHGYYFYQYTFTTKLWIYMMPTHQIAAFLLLGVGWVFSGVLLLKQSTWTTVSYNTLAITSLLYTGMALFFNPEVNVGSIFNLTAAAVILLFVNTPRLVN